MFIRVEPQLSGPEALGILVPYGEKTLVIVRPRTLTFDLLPATWDGNPSHPPVFCEFTRDEAVQVARRLLHALESAVEAGECPVQTFGDAKCAQIWVRTHEFVWIACCRAPGQAYHPLTYGSQEDAVRDAKRLSIFMWPAPDARQEYYFNTQSLA